MNDIVYMVAGTCFCILLSSLTIGVVIGIGSLIIDQFRKKK